MDAGDGRRVEAAEELERCRLAGTLGERVDRLDLKAPRLGQRLDRLHAADIRAREDPAEVTLCELRHERLGLPLPALVERPQGVVLAAQVSRCPARAWRTR